MKPFQYQSAPELDVVMKRHKFHCPETQHYVECQNKSIIFCNMGPTVDLSCPMYAIMEKLIRQQNVAMTDYSTGSNEAENIVEECAEESLMLMMW